MAIRNDKVITDGLIKAKRLIDDQMISALTKTAFDLIEETDVPIWTHNLWDSIGCGIYKNGALMKVLYPPNRATEPRTDIYNAPSSKKEYLGIEELRDSIMNAPASVTSVQGWVLYYVAAMPYSEQVDCRSDVDVLHEEVVKPSFLSHIRKL